MPDPIFRGKESEAGNRRTPPAGAFPTGLTALPTSWATVRALPDLLQQGLEVRMALQVFAYSRVDGRLAAPSCKGRPGSVAMSGTEEGGDEPRDSRLGWVPVTTGGEDPVPPMGRLLC